MIPPLLERKQRRKKWNEGRSSMRVIFLQKQLAAGRFCAEAGILFAILVLRSK